MTATREDRLAKAMRHVMTWPDHGSPAVKRRALEILERLARVEMYDPAEIERRVAAIEVILRRRSAPPKTRATLREIVAIWREAEGANG